MTGPAWLAVVARVRGDGADGARPDHARPAGRGGRAERLDRDWLRRWRPLWALLSGAAAAAFVGGPVGWPRHRSRRSRRGWSSSAPSPLEVRRDSRPGASRPAARGGAAGRRAAVGPAARRRARCGRRCPARSGGGQAGRGGAAAAARGRPRPGLGRPRPPTRPSVRLGRALARAHRTGAPVVPAVERLADELARSARSEVEDRARAVGVKAAVPLGLCLLPAFVLIGIVPLVAGLLTSLGSDAVTAVATPTVHRDRVAGAGLSTARPAPAPDGRPGPAEFESRPRRGHVPEGVPCTARSVPSVTSAASPPPSTPSAPPPAPGSPGCSTRCSPAASATSCSSALRPRPRPARDRLRTVGRRRPERARRGHRRAGDGAAAAGRRHRSGWSGCSRWAPPRCGRSTRRARPHAPWPAATTEAAAVGRGLAVAPEGSHVGVSRGGGEVRVTVTGRVEGPGGLFAHLPSPGSAGRGSGCRRRGCGHAMTGDEPDERGSATLFAVA